MMNLDQLPVVESNIPWRSGKPLLTEQSVSAPKCLRWGYLLAVLQSLLRQH